MPHFSGATYSAELDHARLSTALGRVYEYMKSGVWRTLREISQNTNTTESSASARLRDFRKVPFQRIYNVDQVESKRISGGLWVYRIVIGTNPPVPTEPAHDGFLFDNTPIKPERNNNSARM